MSRSLKREERKVGKLKEEEGALYEACPESKDTKFLNMYNIFNLQKLHCEWIACT